MKSNVFKRDDGISKLNDKIMENMAIAPEIARDMDIFTVFDELIRIRREMTGKIAKARKDLAIWNLEGQVKYNQAITMSSSDFKDLGITNKEGRVAYADLQIAEYNSRAIVLEDNIKFLECGLDEVNLKLKFLFLIAGGDLNELEENC